MCVSKDKERENCLCNVFADSFLIKLADFFSLLISIQDTFQLEKGQHRKKGFDIFF